MRGPGSLGFLHLPSALGVIFINTSLCARSPSSQSVHGYAQGWTEISGDSLPSMLTVVELLLVPATGYPRGVQCWLLLGLGVRETLTVYRAWGQAP